MADFDLTAFEARLRALIGQENADLLLDDVDDELQQEIEGSAQARLCALAAVEILSEANLPEALACALNTAICASCIAGDHERTRSLLEQLVDTTIAHGTDLAAITAASNIHRLLPGTARPDHVPHILRELVRLFVHLGRIEEAIDNLITAANLLADFGAYQPAYGSLADAEELARERRLLPQYVKVISALHATCVQEGDHAYAAKTWSLLQEKYAELGEQVPTALAVNHATSLFQTGDLKGARDGFEQALAQMTPNADFRAGILVNLSACLRELGDRVESDRRMIEARESLSLLGSVDPERLIETELIAAKNSVRSGDAEEAASCLNRAVAALDAAVGLVEKLHYRRGMRERYVSRIERLLVGLPASGRASDVLAIVAASRANRVGDWLHFLDWTRLLSRSLADDDKEELDRLVARIADQGAPHLYGYREKYDDPMSAATMGDPWRDLAEFADKACRSHDVGRPFVGASSPRGASLIRQRLDEGHAVLVNLLTAGHKTMLMIGDRYVICDLPEAETQEFFVALSRHRQEPNQAKALGVATNAYQAALLSCLRPILNELAEASGCKGVIFIPDRMDLTPINLVMLGDRRIRERMASGLFEVRTCLAIYPAQRQIAAPAFCLGIVEADANLRHDRADIEAFLSGTGASGSLLESPTWDEFAAGMVSVDSLVLSHHGMSVGLFRDPYFANMAGPEQQGIMSLALLQQVAFRWPHRLAVLGTCHSGGFINRNYQFEFRSHELMGFPTVFLLNGKAEVMAASWAILDRFNLLFTTLFASGLQHMYPAQAASSALARLVDYPPEALPDLLSQSLPGRVGPTAAELQQVDKLLRQPFCYGTYQVYTLM